MTRGRAGYGIVYPGARLNRSCSSPSSDAATGFVREELPSNSATISQPRFPCGFQVAIFPRVAHPFKLLAFNYIGQLERFALTAYPVNDHLPTAPHGHGKYAELAIITGGAGEHVLEGSRAGISAGDVLIVPTGATHGYADCRGLCLINVLFEPREMAPPSAWQRCIPGYESLFAFSGNAKRPHAFTSRLRLGERSLGNAIALTRRLHDEVVEQRAGYMTAARGLFTALLTELSRHEGTSESPISAALVRLTEVLDWLNRNYSSPLSIHDIAERAHMSRSTLERHFRAAFGTSPGEYLTEVRLLRATDLLTHTTESVAEIAAQVGIADPSYFARLFRKHRGVSPAHFRSLPTSPLEPKNEHPRRRR